MLDELHQEWDKVMTLCTYEIGKILVKIFLINYTSICICVYKMKKYFFTNMNVFKI